MIPTKDEIDRLRARTKQEVADCVAVTCIDPRKLQHLLDCEKKLRAIIMKSDTIRHEIMASGYTILNIDAELLAARALIGASHER